MSESMNRGDHHGDTPLRAGAWQHLREAPRLRTAHFESWTRRDPNPARRTEAIRPVRRQRHQRHCGVRSEEHTSELQSLTNLVCRLLLEKKKKKKKKKSSKKNRRESTQQMKY